LNKPEDVAATVFLTEPTQLPGVLHTNFRGVIQVADMDNFHAQLKTELWEAVQLNITNIVHTLIQPDGTAE
jgi:hypothetical protein